VAKRNVAKEAGKVRVNQFSLVTSVFFILLLFVFLLSATSCTPTEKPSEKPVKKLHTKKKVKKKPAQKAEDQNLGQIAASKEYSYDATGKPDPFVPLIAEITPIKHTAPQQRSKPLTPLQKYDLNELNLVAIIALSNKSSALLEDSAGYGYIITEGMLVGKNDGIVKKITKNGLIVEEKLYNANGDLESKISTLTIQHQK
jgi:Tfp pilus assembly protein PilP